MKRKKTLESDAVNHSNKISTRHTWRTAAASSSSCSNSSITPHYTEAGRSIRIHTRTLCSSVQFNLSGPGTLLGNHTRCLRNKKRNNCNNNTQSSSTMYTYNTDFSIAQATLQSSSMIVHIFALELKKENVNKAKQNISWWTRNSDAEVKRTPSYLLTYSDSYIHDNLSDY